MARIEMREIREGEVPRDGATALQEDADRPAFSGNGPDDYVCVKCGNVLAASMDEMLMTKKVRVRCGRCGIVNVARYDEREDGGGGPGRRRIGERRQHVGKGDPVGDAVMDPATTAAPLPQPSTE